MEIKQTIDTINTMDKQYNLYDNDTLVGRLYTVEDNETPYIFGKQIHIFSQFRRKGYAKTVIDNFVSNHKKPLRFCIATNSESAVTFWKTYLDNTTFYKRNVRGEIWELSANPFDEVQNDDDKTYKEGTEVFTYRCYANSNEIIVNKTKISSATHLINLCDYFVSKSLAEDKYKIVDKVGTKVTVNSLGFTSLTDRNGQVYEASFSEGKVLQISLWLKSRDDNKAKDIFAKKFPKVNVDAMKIIYE